MVDTIKHEARTSLFHTSAETYKSETLDKSEALKTLLIELYIVKDLTVDRRHQIRGREPSNLGFYLSSEVGRAVGMGSPRRRLHSDEKYNTKEVYIGNRFRSDSEVRITNGSVVDIARKAPYKLPLCVPELRAKAANSRMYLYECTGPKTFRRIPISILGFEATVSSKSRMTVGDAVLESATNSTYKLLRCGPAKTQ
jgi:hypothetical protein